jgi:acetyl-CoA acyltransferase
MGGGIALGHPLGCTGSKYGIESMYIGSGMGAAALFELCDNSSML